MIIGIASADYRRADYSGTDKDEWGGAGWARLGQYVQAFKDRGHEVICGTLWQEPFGVSVEDADGNKLWPNVIICQRLMHEGIAEALKWGRKHGQYVINDVDDWFWGMDPSNQAWTGSHPNRKVVQRTIPIAGLPPVDRVVEDSNPENTKHYGSNLAASTILTVSTPYLADRMSKRVSCPIVVIPNYVDVSRFTRVTQQMKPVFGWAGVTSYRSGDLETVAGVFGPAIRNGMRFQHSGVWPGGSTVGEVFKVSDSDILGVAATTSDFYPSLLTFDVGIVPLRDTPFNQAKSDIKGLEYAASGIPFIASDLDSYRALHKEFDGAFHLAKRPKDWLSGIKRYQPVMKRLEDQAILLDKVKTRDIQYGINQWIELLEGLVT